jgi:Protein of unknown function (DUF4058)
MKSPFPGMDPYIEASGLWPDFHPHLISEIKQALAEKLPDRYVVRTDVRHFTSLIVSADSAKDALFPDAIIHPPTGTNPEDAPINMRAFLVDEHHEPVIQIYEPDPEMRLVTCIEVLSPSNKRQDTEGWEVYLRKRKALLLGSANLVEIDLLRGGTRMPMLDRWPDSPYTLLVGRKRRAPYCAVWPASFRQPLPPIPIPLDAPDADITLALQPMIEAIYARSRYHRSIDYSRPLSPSLGDEDTAWLAEQLRARTSPA